MSIFNKKPKMPPEEKEINEVEPMGKYTGLSLENFLKIFEYVKYTKKKWFTVSVEILSDIARVNVYGTDDDFSSVTFIEYIDFTLNDGDVNRWTWPDEKGNAVSDYTLYFNKNEIIALMKENECGYISNCNVYNQMGYSKLWVGKSFVSDKLYELARNARLLSHGSNPYSIDDPTIIYHLDDLRQNADITNSLSMKAGDGMEMVNLDNNIITLYGGMYPITAKDKVSITLYDLHDGSNVSIVEIIKSKPKDLIIKCLLRYRSLS